MEAIGEWRAILAELHRAGVVPGNGAEITPLRGGTTARVGLVSWAGLPRYVIKCGEPRTITAEVLFLEACRGVHLLPRLVHAQPERGYYVYGYVPGRRLRAMPGKAEVLSIVVEQLISRYPPAARCCGWGPLEGPRYAAWSEYLAAEVAAAAERVGPHLSTEDTLLAEAVARLDFPGGLLGDQPHLLHGDLGIHNMLFSPTDRTAGHDRRPALAGVIDPSPLVGPPLYDLLFAFFSSPDELRPDVLLSAAAQLMGPTVPDPSRLLAHALPILYLRIAACLAHHPDDLPAYLRAWSLFKGALLPTDRPR